VPAGALQPQRRLKLHDHSCGRAVNRKKETLKTRTETNDLEDKCTMETLIKLKVDSSKRLIKLVKFYQDSGLHLTRFGGCTP
jgi:hypothetical protein